MKPLILASGSPRRRDLLTELGYRFEVKISPAEEIHCASIPMVDLCELNATLKAKAVAVEFPDAIVLAGDTLVYIDGEPLGKPASREQAMEMLQRLSGRVHQVCSGMCVINGDHVRAFHEVTEVEFRPLTREQIEAYMEIVDVMDKAGAYAAQEHGELVIAEWRGDFSNVVGLPQAAVDRELRALGLQPELT